MSAAHPTRCVPNLAAKPKGEKRLLLADEVAGLRDVAQLALRRPVDRGFVVNTHLQRDIWERVFRHLLKVRATPRERLPSAKKSRHVRAHLLCNAPPTNQVNPAECSLVVTEPLFNLPALMVCTAPLATPLPKAAAT